MPSVSFRVSSMVTSPARPIPTARLIVSLPKVIAERAVLAPEPPKVMLEDDPPERLPDVVEIALFSVSVFEPIDRAPSVRLRVSSRVTSPARPMPFERLIINFPRLIAGRSVLAPDPPKVILEDDPPLRFPDVVKLHRSIIGYLNQLINHR